jgi:hypothetical protein
MYKTAENGWRNYTLLFPSFALSCNSGKNQYLISTQTLVFRSLDQTWSWNHVLEIYSRKGAKSAKLIPVYVME